MGSNYQYFIGALANDFANVIPFEKAAFDNNYIAGPLIIIFAITALWEVNRSARTLLY